LRQRREQVELLSRVSLLGEMTASLAHELNQPLSAVVSNAHAGMRMIDRNMIDSTGMREIFADVAADGQRANEIIRNVRATIKKGGTLQTPINVNDVITSVTRMMHPDAAILGCQIDAAVQNDLPLIKGDPTQIQQVLVNLINNAFDAMRQTPPAERRVEIETKSNNGDGIRLIVRDHGKGITPNMRERLFEQFFTTKEQGLGMGLSIVRSIVEAHGGNIEVDNADGGGARFSITLPASS
jgi:two-component system sensor kinase FixL